MPETVHTNIPEQAGHQVVQAARVQPVLSRVALEGVGVAAQHFYGADDHLVGKTWDGEHRLIVEHAGQGGAAAREAVGTGKDLESALHDSLEQMRTLETARTKSLVRMEMTDTATVDFTTFAHYNPKVAPGTEAYPVPGYLEPILKGDTTGNFTYRNTEAREGWQSEIRSLLDGYVRHDAQGQQLVQGLKIKSLDHLTPEQAVKLSAAFVQNVSKFNHGHEANGSPADLSTTPELLREGINRKDDPEWEGAGVCRNIASNVKAVFESLKATQGELSMLNNTYAVYGGGTDGQGYEDKREDGFSTKIDRTGHAWDTFVTIDAEGSAAATIIDATWALGKDANAAIEHLDRTDDRATSQLMRLYEKSERKPEAFEAFADYLVQNVRRRSAGLPTRSAAWNNIREFATTNYLQAAAELTEIPENHTIPDVFMTTAYQMRGKLEPNEVAAVYALDKTGGSAEVAGGRMQALIKGFDGGRAVQLQIGVHGDRLVFKDDGLQNLAYEAVGPERVAQLAEASGKFRMRLRGQHPEALPPFDPEGNMADAAELQYIASQSGIHDKNRSSIMRAMHRRIKSLTNDEAIHTAIVAGRSEYDLAINFQDITAALRKRTKDK